MDVWTKRLILRRPRPADVSTLFEILGDAQAMRHTRADPTFRDCRQRIAVHERCRHRNGYAPWTILAQSDGRILGWGGLYDDPFDPGWGVEVGYFFHPREWGNGFATELVAASLKIAGELRLDEVKAFAHPANTGSRRVLAKNGFEEVRLVPAMDRLLYRRGVSSVSPRSALSF